VVKTKVGVDTLELPLVTWYNCTMGTSKESWEGFAKMGKPTGPIPENRLIRTPLPGLGGSGTGGSKENLRCSGLWGKTLPRD